MMTLEEKEMWVHEVQSLRRHVTELRGEAFKRDCVFGSAFADMALDACRKWLQRLELEAVASSESFPVHGAIVPSRHRASLS